MFIVRLSVEKDIEKVSFSDTRFLVLIVSSINQFRSSVSSVSAMARRIVSYP